jgi:DNA repair protein RadD
MITSYPRVYQRRPLFSLMLSIPPVRRQPHISLYAFQLNAIDEIEQHIAEGRRKLLLVAPTGSGKTVIASELIRRYVTNHRTILFLAHRREIIQQTSAKLTANSVRHGIFMAGIEPRPLEAVQVASIDTLLVRGVRSGAMKLPLADLIVFDEAHRARGRTREHLIGLYPDAARLGMTATPCRGDGRGLGSIFETLIECPQISELIEGGYLVKSRVYAPVDPDLKGVKTRQGDYVVGELEDRMNTDILVGSIVEHWFKYGERRRTVVFAVGVEHSVHIRNEFIKAGVRAEHLDGNTSIAEREAILARLTTGETEVVTNCMVLTEGWDCPPVGCCILARPTRQMGLYRQMIGRVLRPTAGKTDCIILDHSGAVYRHGLPEDHVLWTLDTDKRAKTPAQEKRKEGEEPRLRKCPNCQVIMSRPPCACCGWAPRPRQRARNVDFAAGELALVTSSKAKPVQYSPEERKRWFGMFAVIAAERNYKQPQWARCKYKEKFGSYPPWGVRPEPVVPTAECKSWVKSRMIAWYRSAKRS